MKSTLYPPEFYDLPTLELARNILGAKLTTISNAITTSGMVVEVEAYHQIGDAAAHSYKGRTHRNQVMFGPPGYCYVYFIYGIHHCVNIVSEPSGVGAAILIRAIEPLQGIEVMRERRGVQAVIDLANGPGKLCQALDINRSFNGETFFNSSYIKLERYFEPPTKDIATSRRIGITKATELEWRFYLRTSLFVSGGKMAVK